jgi:hypothetical protein
MQEESHQEIKLSKFEVNVIKSITLFFIGAPAFIVFLIFSGIFWYGLSRISENNFSIRLILHSGLVSICSLFVALYGTGNWRKWSYLLKFPVVSLSIFYLIAGRIDLLGILLLVTVVSGVTLKIFFKRKARPH